MTPGVEALLDYVTEVAQDSAVSLETRLRLTELVENVRMEDPLALAFQRAVAGFRKKQG